MCRCHLWIGLWTPAQMLRSCWPKFMINQASDNSPIIRKTQRVVGWVLESRLKVSCVKLCLRRCWLLCAGDFLTSLPVSFRPAPLRQAVLVVTLEKQRFRSFSGEWQQLGSFMAQSLLPSLLPTWEPFRQEQNVSVFCSWCWLLQWRCGSLIENFLEINKLTWEATGEALTNIWALPAWDWVSNVVAGDLLENKKPTQRIL